MKNAPCLKALLFLVLLPSAPLAGQQPGDIVRVSGDLTAEFIRADSTGLYLSSGFVPYSDITSLELRTGTQSRWKDGMLIGAGVGAAAGLGAGLISCGGDESTCVIVAVLLTPISGLLGGVVGTAVGAGMRTDRFTPVLLPTLGVGTSTNPRGRFGLTLGMQLRF